MDNFEKDHEDNYDEALETALIRMEEAEKMAILKRAETEKIKMEEADKMAILKRAETEKIKLPPIRLSPVLPMSQLSNTGSA